MNEFQLLQQFFINSCIEGLSFLISLLFWFVFLLRWFVFIVLFQSLFYWTKFPFGNNSQIASHGNETSCRLQVIWPIIYQSIKPTLIGSLNYYWLKYCLIDARRRRRRLSRINIYFLDWRCWCVFLIIRTFNFRVSSCKLCFEYF